MTSAIGEYLYDYDYVYQNRQQANDIMSQYIRQYISSLQEDYPYVNSNDYLVGGVQTTVNVSFEYIKTCMQDPHEAQFLEIMLSEIPNLVMDVIFGGYGNVSNITYEIDDYGEMSVSITTDKTPGAIKSIQERRRIEDEKANKLLENFEKINQALSEAMAWNSSNESSFLLSLNQDNNTFSILGIQNQLTKNNITNIISSNITDIIQYALNYSDNTTTNYDALNMGYTIPTGLYMLNRVWSA